MKFHLGIRRSAKLFPSQSFFVADNDSRVTWQFLSSMFNSFERSFIQRNNLESFCRCAYLNAVEIRRFRILTRTKSQSNWIWSDLSGISLNFDRCRSRSPLSLLVAFISPSRKSCSRCMIISSSLFLSASFPKLLQQNFLQPHSSICYESARFLPRSWVVSMAF